MVQRWKWSGIAAALVFTAGAAASQNELEAGGFHPPVRVLGGGEPIAVESPGYACPALADVDGDGIADLLVGQFRDGKIRVYRGGKDGRFAAGQWLMAGEEVAKVPGVW